VKFLNIILTIIIFSNTEPVTLYLASDFQKKQSQTGLRKRIRKAILR